MGPELTAAVIILGCVVAAMVVSIAVYYSLYYIQRNIHSEEPLLTA